MNPTRLILIGIIIPTVLSVVVHTGYTTNYTTGTFHLVGFKSHYTGGIYKYRVLGRALALQAHHLTRRANLPPLAQATALSPLDPNADPSFYAALFYMNTLFLILSSSAICLLIKDSYLTLWLVGLMALGQYVITPYDTLSYFLILSAALIITDTDLPTPTHIISLTIITATASLTRESAILIPALCLAHHHRPILSGHRPHRIALLLSVAAFAIPYLVLRIYYGVDHALYQSVVDNINLLSALGLAFGLAQVFILFQPPAPTRKMALFLILSLPYLLPILLIAYLWEIRLFTPIILLLAAIKATNQEESSYGTIH